MQGQPMSAGNQCETYRLLIERRNGAEILLIPNRHDYSLPAVEIPRWERVAPCVISALKEVWNIEAYCLFSPAPVHAAREATDFKYQLVEIRRPNVRLPSGWHWTPVESVSERMFASSDDFQTIHSALDELAAYADGSRRGFFGKPGWLQEVFGWIEQKINPLGLRLTGRFRQLNASPAFSLIRIETNGPALWFKAVGEPNLRECPITIELAKRFSGYLPEIIAVRSEWNAWLTTEVQGSHPDESSAFQVWKAVAKALADLQIKSFGQTLHLVEAGCGDLRLYALVDCVKLFLEIMVGLMERQTKISPTPLSRSELLTLGVELHDAFSTIEYSEMPNTLGHLDFNLGNILVHDDRSMRFSGLGRSLCRPSLSRPSNTLLNISEVLAPQVIFLKNS